MSDLLNVKWCWLTIVWDKYLRFLIGLPVNTVETTSLLWCLAGSFQIHHSNLLVHSLQSEDLLQSCWPMKSSERKNCLLMEITSCINVNQRNLLNDHWDRLTNALLLTYTHFYNFFCNCIYPWFNVLKMHAYCWALSKL